METPLSLRVPDTALPIMEFAQLAALDVVPAGKRYADRLRREAGPGGCSGDLMRPEEVTFPDIGREEARRLFEIMEARSPVEARVGSAGDGWNGLKTTWDIPTGNSPLFGLRRGSYLTIRIRAEFELLCCDLHDMMRTQGILTARPVTQMKFVQEYWGTCQMLSNSLAAMRRTDQLDRVEKELYLFALSIHRTATMIVMSRG